MSRKGRVTPPSRDAGLRTEVSWGGTSHDWTPQCSACSGSRAVVLFDTVFFSALAPLLPHYIPFFGALFPPALALQSTGAKQLGLNQGIAFGLSNLAWAAGQAFSAAVTGVLAQATSDVVPYALLAGACFLTLSNPWKELVTLTRPGR